MSHAAHADAPAAAPPVAAPPRWLRVAAALPALATAASFLAAWLQWGSPYATAMAKGIELEFLVIHSGIFIGIFVLMPVETPGFRVLRWVAVSLLALLYGVGAFGLLGWYGVLLLAGVFVGTYAGYLFAPRGPGAPSRGRRVVEIAVRWLVSLLAYMLLSSAFSLPTLVNDWVDHRTSVAMGCAYFLVLALVESSLLYPRIRGDVPGRFQRLAATER